MKGEKQIRGCQVLEAEGKETALLTKTYKLNFQNQLTNKNIFHLFTQQTLSTYNGAGSTPDTAQKEV